MAKQKIKVIREEMLQVASNVAQEKNINQDDVFMAMEQALEKSARVKYGMERDIRVSIDRDTGNIKLESYLKVVNTFSEEEQAREILLEDATKIKKDVHLTSGENQPSIISRSSIIVAKANTDILLRIKFQTPFYLISWVVFPWAEQYL